MKFCSKCGKELFDEAVICPNCGCATEPSKEMVNNSEDGVSVGLCVLAVLIPLFGFIYWPVNHKKAPKKAMACGVSAIVAWVIYMLIFFSI